MLNLLNSLRGFALFLVTMAATAAVPEVSFVDRKSGDSVTLDQFAGDVVVLDYFAFWCAPCAPASRKIEDGVAKYYAGRSTNSVRVHVLGVNVEQARPDKTEKFITKAGIGHVVEDAMGASLDAFGARSLPFIVVLDGRRAAGLNGSAGWEIAYQHNGLESIEKLRAVIDGLIGGDER